MNVLIRIVVSIVRTRFVPLEVLLGISSFLHGLWLIMPGWSTKSVLTTITGAPRGFEFGFGVAFAALGIAILVLIVNRVERGRGILNMLQFIFWLFAASLSVIATGFDGIEWVTLLTVAFASALVYLNVTVGNVSDGGD